MPIAEARAHRSEEEWLKAWEDRSSSGILGEIEVVVKDRRKGVRVRKKGAVGLGKTGVIVGWEEWWVVRE